MRNKTVDVLKLFFAICIILIHTELADVIPNGFVIKSAIWRLGVPFFFICSGYFFSKSSSTNNIVKRLLIPYLFWGIVYIILSYFILHNSISLLIKDCFKMIFGSFNNVMWYSGSLIWSLIIVSRLNSKKKLIVSIAISFILFLIGLSFNTYSFILNSFFPSLYDALVFVFEQNRSFWFSGFLYVGIGYYIGKYNKFKCSDIKSNIIALVFSYILLMFEIKFVEANLVKPEYDFFIFHIPVVVELFLIVLKRDFVHVATINIRNVATGIYYVHFLVVLGFRYLYNVGNVLNYKSYNYTFMVIIITILIVIMLNRINNKYINKIIR